MKKPSREINIFSMSALDLFASAMGAFILITIILLPYFPNTGDSPERIEAIKAALSQCQKDLKKTRQQLQQAQQERDACKTELSKTFVLVLMSWGKRDDIDLHVVDPANREYYYRKRSFSGSPAKFEEDNTRGPGNEIWLHPKADPGEYRIYYKYFSRRSEGSVSIRGAVLHKGGRIPITTQTLGRKGEKRLITTVIVTADGNVSVR